MSAHSAVWDSRCPAVGPHLPFMSQLQATFHVNWLNLVTPATLSSLSLPSVMRSLETVSHVILPGHIALFSLNISRKDYFNYVCV